MEVAREIEYAELRAVASGLFQGATGFVRAQNVATALEEVRKLLSYTDTMSTLMAAISHVEGEGEEALATLFGGLERG